MPLPRPRGAGEPDRYLAALLAPAGRARRPAGAGGVLGRARARAVRSSRASRRWARSACSGGAMRWTAPAPARTGNPRRRRRCAPLSRATACSRALLLDADRCARRRDLRPSRCRTTRRCAHYLWKTEGVPVRPGGAHPGAAARRRRWTRPPRPAATPTVWRGCCSACRTRCRTGACRCRRSLLGGAGVGQRRAAGRRGGADRRRRCLRPCARGARSSLATSRQHVANLPRAIAGGFPSFGLGRALFAGAGTAGPRPAARRGRDRAADARVQDCRRRIGSAASERRACGGHDGAAQRLEGAA